LTHGAKYFRDFFRRLGAEIANPRDVVVDAAGNVALGPNVEKQKVAFFDGRGTIGGRAVMRIAGVGVDGDVGAFFGPEPGSGELLQNPLLQTVLRLRLAFANAARGELERLGDDAVDMFGGVKMRFELL